MAATVHNTILLDQQLSSGLPVNGYKVVHDGLSQVYEPAIMVERSITGKLHTQRILSAGEPIVYSGFRYTLFLTRAEKTQLAEDLGKYVYFMPHYRDDASPASYRSVMLFRSMTDVENIDPHLEYYNAVIELVEATGHTDLS